MYGDASVRKASFIEGNFQTLISDAARGNGEQLNTFAALYGCSEHSLFGKTIQGNFNQLFLNRNENDAFKIIEDVDAVIKASPALQATCQKITI